MVLLQQGHHQEWGASPPCPRNPATAKAWGCRPAFSCVPEDGWSQSSEKTGQREDPECKWMLAFSDLVKMSKDCFCRKTESGVASAISSVNVGGYAADPSDGETWGQNPVRSATPFWSPWTLPELWVQSIKRGKLSRTREKSRVVK